MRHTVAWALVAAVVVGAIALGATMLLMAPEQRADDVVRAQAAAPPTTPAPSPAPEPEPSEPTDDPSPRIAESDRVAVSSARLSDVNADDDPAPVRLVVDDIAISGAPIDPVGVEPDGGMEIPTDVSRVGWYEYGPQPGADQGTAVLTAHIDDRTQGKGVFYDLDELAAGDDIAVEMDDGSVERFTVDEIRQIPKVDLPTGDLFRRDGDPRLALITCGGQFDEASRHYLDNIVVLASPA